MRFVWEIELVANDKRKGVKNGVKPPFRQFQKEPKILHIVRYLEKDDCDAFKAMANDDQRHA